MDPFFTQYFLEREETIFENFFKFLRFQTISQESSSAKEMRNCVFWLKEIIEKIGLKTQVFETKGHPILIATYQDPKANLPTLLLYNHYDVQPTDPQEEWTTPPFNPSLREGAVFARGAQDNKGQLFYTLVALSALMKRDGKLPVNLKWCIEGEEECGSSSLFELLKTDPNLFKADHVAVIDVGLPDKNTPAVTLGVRGIVTFDLIVKGAHSDLHSGILGGMVSNPIHTLVNLLSALRHPDGSLAIPGFYEGICPMQEEEKKHISWTFDPEKFLEEIGVPPLGGERAFPPLERAWIRPTLEINGIFGGYTKEGFKTVIPKIASAKLSCRLVPGQNPKTISALVKDFLENLPAGGNQVQVIAHPGQGEAVRANPSSAVVQAFSLAYKEVFGKETAMILDGGSIPIASKLAQTSGGQLVLVGMGLSSDHIHAPNEHFAKERFQKGYLIIVSALLNLKKLKSI